MLRLNASVHSWLTRQEMKIAKANEQRRLAESENPAQVDQDTKSSVKTSRTVDTSVQIDDLHVDHELHKQLKNEVGDMYSAWDEADLRYLRISISMPFFCSSIIHFQ